jgi:hypothetical protein
VGPRASLHAVKKIKISYPNRNQTPIARSCSCGNIKIPEDNVLAKSNCYSPNNNNKKSVRVHVFAIDNRNQRE